jgi:sulfite reductase alpha subunit-like flavoprotein
METTSNLTRLQPDFTMETRASFNVVIMYEDFAAGKHAKETYDYLVQHLEREYEFTNQMWKFDVLTNAKMKEMAVKDAVMADLIIVSAHGLGELPREVKSWIEQWVPQKSNAMAALAALVNPPDGDHAPHAESIRRYLQDVAQRAGIGFFSQPAEWAEREDDFSMGQDSNSAERASTFVSDFIQHNTMNLHAQASLPIFAGVARWGINE